MNQSQYNQQPSKDKQSDHPTFALQGKYHNYKMLIAPINMIIKDIQAVKFIIIPPQKKRKFPLADKSKNCKFHHDYEHDTNEHEKLEDEIETLIKRGQLSKYKWYREQDMKNKRAVKHERSYSPRG